MKNIAMEDTGGFGGGGDGDVGMSGWGGGDAPLPPVFGNANAQPGGEVDMDFRVG